MIQTHRLSDPSSSPLDCKPLLASAAGLLHQTSRNRDQLHIATSWAHQRELPGGTEQFGQKFRVARTQGKRFYPLLGGASQEKPLLERAREGGQEIDVEAREFPMASVGRMQEALISAVQIRSALILTGRHDPCDLHLFA